MGQPVIAADAVIEEGATIEPWCVVGAGSRIGRGTRLGAGSYVGADVVIGEECDVAPGVVIMDHIRIGNRVRLSPGVVLGSDGFGYVEDGGVHDKIPQVGRIEVGDDVSVAAGACIDRATTGVTRIGDGSVLGPMVQIGHNVQIGARCHLEAQAGIAGSTVLSDEVRVEPQAGVQQHLTIGRGVHIGPRAGVIKDIPAGEHVTGFPARPLEETRRIEQAMDALPGLVRQLRQNPGQEP